MLSLYSTSKSLDLKKGICIAHRSARRLKGFLRESESKSADTYCTSTHIDLAGGPIIQPGIVIPVYGLDLVNETYYYIHGPSNANLAINIQWHDDDSSDSIYSEGMSGFYIDDYGFVGYYGDVPFETFTACGGLYGSVCPEDCSGWVTTLSWRNTTSVPDLVKCADVKLHAAWGWDGCVWVPKKCKQKLGALKTPGGFTSLSTLGVKLWNSFFRFYNSYLAIRRNMVENCRFPGPANVFKHRCLGVLSTT